MQHEKTTYFSFCQVESGSRERCDTMLTNSMQCRKQVVKYVLFTSPNITEHQVGRNFCEAHFQIELAKAQRDGAFILNKNEESELEKIKAAEK